MTNKTEFQKSCDNIFHDLELKDMFQKAKEDFKCELNTGRNLRYIRKNYLKLSKKDLSKKLNISEKTVYNWEQKDYVKMANYLSVIALIDNNLLA